MAAGLGNNLTRWDPGRSWVVPGPHNMSVFFIHLFFILTRWRRLLGCISSTPRRMWTPPWASVIRTERHTNSAGWTWRAWPQHSFFDACLSVSISVQFYELVSQVRGPGLRYVALSRRCMHAHLRYHRVRNRPRNHPTPQCSPPGARNKKKTN